MTVLMFISIYFEWRDTENQLYLSPLDQARDWAEKLLTDINLLPRMPVEDNDFDGFLENDDVIAE